MSPSLMQARERRWWIAITSALENLMFAAVLLGWSSLLLMLKSEGFYAHVCNQGNGTTGCSNNTDHVNESSHDAIDPHHGLPSAPPCGCEEQDEILNRYYTIGSSLLSGVTVILGVIMDKYGCRHMRLCGCITFMVSCICFIIGSNNTEEYSILIAPAVCLNGMGGVVYVFTSFQVPNLFENIRSTMISVMIGSYSASAIIYMIFKAAYDMGVSFQTLMTIHACIAFLTFINCYFNIPLKPFPGPDDITYAIRFKHKEMRYDHKVTGKQFLRHSSSVGRRMSSMDVAPDASLLEIAKHDQDAEDSMTFGQVLLTPCVLWSFVTMCLTQLRLIAYMGWIELYFTAATTHLEYTEEDQEQAIEFYSFVFGLVQINCFLMAPIIGTIMDWKLKECEKDINSNDTNAKDGKHSDDSGNNESKSKIRRKLQQIRNLCRAFTITNILLVIFGILILFESNLGIQYIAFIIHTIVRTFLHSSTGGLYAAMYHFSHFGKLTGLASFLSAIFILISDPLFVLINGPLHGDPFWVNLVLLLASILGFGLPAYLFMYSRRLVKEYKSFECGGDVKHELPAIKEEPEEDFIGSNASVLSKSHLKKVLEYEPDVYSSLSAITF